MTVHDDDYCIRVEHDADGGVFLALYHGTMALGAPVAECHYDAVINGSFVVPTLVVTSAEADVSPTALDWLRERGESLLPPPGLVMPDLDVDRQSFWYYIGGTVVLLGSAADQWRNAAAHGGIWTVLLAAAAGGLLLVGYRQYRRLRARAS